MPLDSAKSTLHSFSHQLDLINRNPQPFTIIPQSFTATLHLISTILQSLTVALHLMPTILQSFTTTLHLMPTTLHQFCLQYIVTPILNHSPSL